MSAAVIWGLLAGLATIGVSELLLRVWGSRPIESFWKLSLLGMGLRAAWVLGVLTVVLASGRLDPAAFTLAFVAGYLAAQVLEGFRYKRFIRTR